MIAAVLIINMIYMILAFRRELILMDQRDELKIQNRELREEVYLLRKEFDNFFTYEA